MGGDGGGEAIVQSPSHGERPGLTRTAQVILLGVVWFLYTVHSMDRSILFLVMPDVQQEFRLSNQQVGLLSGLAYALPAALCAIPFGVLGDRRDRKTILVVLVLAWSAATGLSALAASFLVLICLRAMVGGIESGAPPIMLSVLADAFSPLRRPLALSIYYTAANAGVVLAGLLVHHAGAGHGWRQMMLMAAVPGLAVAFTVFAFVKFPAHHPGASGSPAAAPVMATFRQLFRLPGFALVYVACVLGGMNTMAIGAWLSVFLVRGQGATIAEAGTIVALAQGLAGVVGGLTGGAVATRFGQGRLERLCLVAACALGLSAPMGIAAGLVAGPGAAGWALAAWAFFAMMFIAPAHSALLQQVPQGIRATAAAMLIVGSQLVGAGLGPQLVAAFADLFGRQGEGPALRHAIALMASGTLVPAGLFVWCAVSRRLSISEQPA